MDWLNNFFNKIIVFLTGDKKKPYVYLTHKSYLNWKWLRKGIITSKKYVNGICADIGCGEAPYKRILLEKVDKYIMVDDVLVRKHFFRNSKEEFINANILNLPFEDSSFDTIILTQVLEHVKEPFKALDEVYRVLRKGGVLILSVPFIYHAHAIPYDYYRFSEYALKEIAKSYNYKIEEIIYQGYFGTTIISIVNDFLWEICGKYKLIRNTFLLPFLLGLFALNNIIGLVLDLFRLKNFTPNFMIVLRKK